MDWVDIGMSSWAKHGSVRAGFSAGSVTSRIIHREVGFRFYDDARRFLASDSTNQTLPQQAFGDFNRGAIEKMLGKLVVSHANECSSSVKLCGFEERQILIGQFDMWKTIFSCVCLLLGVALVFSQTPNATGQQIVSQNEISEDACGPCAMITALANSKYRDALTRMKGDTLIEKAQAIIDEFGSLPSVTYQDQPRFGSFGYGMAPEDISATFSDVAKKLNIDVSLEGMYLERRENESLSGQLERVHSMFLQSLDRGMPVVTSFRSFIASESGNTDEQGNKKFLWYGKGNHYVTIVGVQPELRPNERGFSIEYLDTDSHQKAFGYVYFDQVRNFTAIRGNIKHFKWLKNRPFLCAVLPSLDLKTSAAPFYQRSVITLSYAIFPKSVKDGISRKDFGVEMEVACGQCQFDMEGEGCDLAIRRDGQAMYVTGAEIDDFGDAHADDGFCNCVRKAMVTGYVVDGGKYQIEKLILLPIARKNTDTNSTQANAK